MWFLPSGFPTNTPHFHSPPPLYVPHVPFLSAWYEHPHIWWAQIIKRPIMQSVPVPCYLVPLVTKYLPQPTILMNHSPCLNSTPKRRTVSRPDTTTGIITVLYIIIFIFFDNEKVLLRVKEQRNILHEISKRKANWIGHILRRNCLPQRVIEGKIKGGIKMTGRRGRRCRKLLDDFNP